MFKTLPLFVTAFVFIIELSISFNSVLLPNLQDSFTISDSLASFTIGLGIFSLGVAAMVYGSICDGLGRRPIILISSCLFCFGTLISLLATNVTILIIGRLLQGFGAGAGWVVGNASLKDIFHGKEYGRVINHLHAIVGIVPAIGPVLGSYLVGNFDWRHIFGFLLFASLILLFLQFFKLPETILKRETISWNIFLKNYKLVLGNHNFQFFALFKVLMVTLLYTDVSIYALILVNHLGVADTKVGIYILPLFLAYVIMTLIAENFFAKYFSKENILVLAIFMVGCSGILQLIIYYLFVVTPWLLQLSKLPVYMGFGLCFGNATGCIVASVPNKAGSAAAMMIALEMLFSSCGIAILGYFYNGTIAPYGFLCLVIAVFVLLVNKYIKTRP